MSTSTSLGSALRDLVRPVVAISDEQIERLEQHFSLLLKWNARMNLTRVTDPVEAATRHYGESLFLAARLTPGTVLDIGSGAGFPGIPAAIVRPECEFHLIDSNRRKCVFLREASRNLPNIRVSAERARDVQGRYDWAISRAVAPNDILAVNAASHLALLIGEEDAVTLLDFDVTPLPWGAHRVLAIR
jgi:16S rRNA (guanine(527)-N(7))-methyltransferase RsmG